MNSDFDRKEQKRATRTKETLSKGPPEYLVGRMKPNMQQLAF